MMRLILFAAAAAVVLGVTAGPARTETPEQGRAAGAGTLERVRAAGVLRCGSAIRPGLAFPALDHSWHGLNVDLCHAIAAAAIGPGARVEFNGYALGKDFDRIRGGQDDVAFLTTTELYANQLVGAVLVGPVVFHETTNVMVWDTSKVRHVSELGNTMVCAEPGTPAERNLRSYAATHDWRVNFSEWMELEEMMDAYAVGRCPAVVGEMTGLAALRLSGQGGHASRLLPEPLAVTPVMATSRVADGGWANVVAWTLNTVLWAAQPHPLPDAQSLVLPGIWLGLGRDWQAHALAAAGDIAAMQRRSLGSESPLDLPAGLEAGWQQGGLLAAPAIE